MVVTSVILTIQFCDPIPIHYSHW